MTAGFSAPGGGIIPSVGALKREHERKLGHPPKKGRKKRQKNSQTVGGTASLKLTTIVTLIAALGAWHLQSKVEDATPVSLSAVGEYLHDIGMTEIPKLRASCKVSPHEEALIICAVDEDSVSVKTGSFEISGSSHPFRFTVGVVNGRAYRLYGFGKDGHFNELAVALGRRIETRHDALSQVGFFLELVRGAEAPLPLNPDGTVSDAFVYEELDLELSPATRSRLVNLASKKVIVPLSVKESQGGSFVVNFDGVYEEFRKTKLGHFALSVEHSGAVGVVAIEEKEVLELPGESRWPCAPGQDQRPEWSSKSGTASRQGNLPGIVLNVRLSKTHISKQ